MRFEWNERKIDLYVRASRKTEFHKKLAEQILPYFSKEDEITDIGCGPGVIDFELSPFVKSIRAIDIEPIIINYLSNEIISRNASNITTSIGDLEKIEENVGDVVLFCYFSSISEHMNRIINAAGRLAIIIMHGDETVNKSSKISASFRRTYSSEMENFLIENGHTYLKKDMVLDFSQPLESEEEAKEFLEIYCTEEDLIKRRVKLDEGNNNIKQSDDPQYPYIIPCMKNVAIFIIKK